MAVEGDRVFFLCRLSGLKMSCFLARLKSETKEACVLFDALSSQAIAGR